MPPTPDLISSLFLAWPGTADGAGERLDALTQHLVEQIEFLPPGKTPIEHVSEWLRVLFPPVFQTDAGGRSIHSALSAMDPHKRKNADRLIQAIADKYPPWSASPSEDEGDPQSEWGWTAMAGVACGTIGDPAVFSALLAFPTVPSGKALSHTLINSRIPLNNPDPKLPKRVKTLTGWILDLPDDSSFKDRQITLLEQLHRAGVSLNAPVDRKKNIPFRLAGPAYYVALARLGADPLLSLPSHTILPALQWTLPAGSEGERGQGALPRSPSYVAQRAVSFLEAMATVFRKGFWTQAQAQELLPALVKKMARLFCEKPYWSHLEQLDAAIQKVRVYPSAPAEQWRVRFLVNMLKGSGRGTHSSIDLFENIGIPKAWETGPKNHPTSPPIVPGVPDRLWFQMARALAKGFFLPIGNAAAEITEHLNQIPPGATLWRLYTKTQANLSKGARSALHQNVLERTVKALLAEMKDGGFDLLRSLRENPENCGQLGTYSLAALCRAPVQGRLQAEDGSHLAQHAILLLCSGGIARESALRTLASLLEAPAAERLSPQTMDALFDEAVLTTLRMVTLTEKNPTLIAMAKHLLLIRSLEPFADAPMETRRPRL